MTADKKIKERKRHLLVDTYSLLVEMSLTASIEDRDAAHSVMAATFEKHPASGRFLSIAATLDAVSRPLRSASTLMSRWYVMPPIAALVSLGAAQSDGLFSVQADTHGYFVQAKRWVVV